MMTFKKKWISVLASAMAFVLCCIFGVVFALDTKNVSAETTYDYETYDVLYTDDFSVVYPTASAGALTDGEWNVTNDQILDFTPSSENTTESFIWNFQYTATQITGAINIYPLSQGTWNGAAPFDFNQLPLSYIAETDTHTYFTQGQIYDVEFGVVKIKNSENYHVFVKVDGKMVLDRKTADKKGRQLYFYTTNGATGTCSSTRPAVVVDRLTNSDWTIVNANTYTEDYAAGATMPTEWAVPTNGNSITYIDFTPTAENVSASFVWEFDFLCTVGGKNFNIYPFAGGQWPQDVPAIDIAAKYGTDGFTAGEIYKIEIGTISTSARFNDNYRVYVAVDGKSVYNEVLSASLKTSNAANGKGLSVYFNGDCKGVLVGEEKATTPVEPADPYAAYETYDVLCNSDWTYKTSTTSGTLGDTWDMANGYYLDFTPTANNTTKSFVWKFKYTHAATSGAMNIYAFANGVWGNTANATVLNFNSCEFAAGNTYDVEICVLKLKDSNNYELFYVVDGVKKASRTISATWSETDDKGNVKSYAAENADGLYFYMESANGINGTCSQLIDYSAYVDTYDELYNQNWAWKTNNANGALGNSWTMANNYHLDFTPTANNTTKSFIWKFKYTHAATSGAMNIYAFANGVWGNTANATFLDFNSCGFAAGKTYNVEICLLKLKNSNNYEFFYVVDGVKKASRTISATWSEGNSSYAANNADGLYFYGNAANGTCVSDYNLACETYDVLYNADWSIYSQNNGAADSVMGAEEAFKDNQFINFTPTKENTTGSFVWKFKYKATSADASGANFYPLSSGIWGTGSAFIDFNTLKFELNTEYEVEFGVLKIKNTANNYYIFVKADGELVKEMTATRTHNVGENSPCPSMGCTDDACSKHTGIYFYIADASYAATCKQDGVTVEVNGETQLVASGTTVLDILGVSGLLPADRPDGYTTTWYDGNGNKVNASTAITDNVTLVPTYTYNYTIVNVAGETLHSYEHVYGNEASFNGSDLTVDRTTFTGYVVGDTLYQDLTAAIDASAASGEGIVAKTVTLGLVDGASIRVDGTPSIRFTATIDKSEADANTQIVNYGMLLTTKDTLDTIADFTIEALKSVDDSLYHNLDKENGMRYVENSKYPGQYVYSLILDKVSASNYGVEYVARAYAVVKYADGTYEIIYSEFDETEHARSMYEVASAANQDVTTNYTAAQKAVIQQHIDGVIDLSYTFALQGDARNYDVTVTNNNDGTHTVKITAKNNFDIRNIGAIYVDGEKIPVYDVNFSAGTFIIKETDISVGVLDKFNDFLVNQKENRELVINAYSGPSLGLKVDSSGAWVDGGYNFTLADLETYMEAGFDAWRLEISPYTQVLNYAPNGTVIKDIYYALDLAAQYAQKYNKPCKVYVHIPEVTGLVLSDAGIESIQTIYSQLTTYDDGISGRNGVPSPVNGINQIAGFLLMDEPYISDVTAFEYIFKILNDSGEVTFDQTSFTIAKTEKTHTLNEATFTACGAGAAGYDYQIALLPSYAAASKIGSSYQTYVETYAAILKDTTMGFDNYPFKTYSSFDTSWFSDMEVNRAQSNGYGTCIQSYTAGTGGSKKITYEQEISMQVYTALAYGFTNLDYFTYGDRVDYEVQKSEWNLAEVYKDVPVQWNDYSDWSQGYTLKSMYTWIQNTNAEAISLYDALGKFTNNGVQLIKGSTTNNIFGKATTTNTTNAINVSSTYDMVVGGFKCGEQNGYLAVNADLPTKGNRTTSATFTLTGYNKAIVYVDGVARVERITNGTLTLNIGAGEGVFIVPMA